MKRQSLGLTLSLLASLVTGSAFALSPLEQARMSDSQTAPIHQYKLVADNGPDRLVQQYQRVS